MLIEEILFKTIITAIIAVLGLLVLYVIELRERVGLLLVAWQLVQPWDNPRDFLEHDLKNNVEGGEK